MLTRKQKELFDYLTDYISKNSISVKGKLGGLNIVINPQIKVTV